MADIKSPSTAKEEKSQICQVCSKKMDDNNLMDLLFHSLGHSGIKPFQCHVCQEKFLHGTTVKEHYATMHPHDQFQLFKRIMTEEEQNRGHLKIIECFPHLKRILRPPVANSESKQVATKSVSNSEASCSNSESKQQESPSLKQETANSDDAPCAESKETSSSSETKHEKSPCPTQDITASDDASCAESEKTKCCKISREKIPIKCKICAKFVFFCCPKAPAGHATEHLELKPFQCLVCMKNFAHSCSAGEHFALNHPEKEFVPFLNRMTYMEKCDISSQVEKCFPEYAKTTDNVFDKLFGTQKSALDTIENSKNGGQIVDRKTENSERYYSSSEMDHILISKQRRQPIATFWTPNSGIQFPENYKNLSTSKPAPVRKRKIEGTFTLDNDENLSRLAQKCLKTTPILATTEETYNLINPDGDRDQDYSRNRQLSSSQEICFQTSNQEQDKLKNTQETFDACDGEISKSISKPDSTPEPESPRSTEHSNKQKCEGCSKVINVVFCTDHILSHLNIKRFSCPVCGNEFSRSYPAKKHVSARHPDQTDVPIKKRELTDEEKEEIRVKKETCFPYWKLCQKTRKKRKANQPSEATKTLEDVKANSDGCAPAVLAKRRKIDKSLNSDVEGRQNQPIQKNENNTKSISKKPHASRKNRIVDVPTKSKDEIGKDHFKSTKASRPTDCSISTTDENKTLQETADETTIPEEVPDQSTQVPRSKDTFLATENVVEDATEQFETAKAPIVKDGEEHQEDVNETNHLLMEPTKPEVNTAFQIQTTPNISTAAFTSSNSLRDSDTIVPPTSGATSEIPDEPTSEIPDEPTSEIPDEPIEHLKEANSEQFGFTPNSDDLMLSKAIETHGTSVKTELTGEDISPTPSLEYAAFSAKREEEGISTNSEDFGSDNVGAVMEQNLSMQTKQSTESQAVRNDQAESAEALEPLSSKTESIHSKRSQTGQSFPFHDGIEHDNETVNHATRSTESFVSETGQEDETLQETIDKVMVEEEDPSTPRIENEISMTKNDIDKALKVSENSTENSITTSAISIKEDGEHHEADDQTANHLMEPGEMATTFNVQKTHDVSTPAPVLTSRTIKSVPSLGELEADAERKTQDVESIGSAAVKQISCTKSAAGEAGARFEEPLPAVHVTHRALTPPQAIESLKFAKLIAQMAYSCKSKTWRENANKQIKRLNGENEVIEHFALSDALKTVMTHVNEEKVQKSEALNDSMSVTEFLNLIRSIILYPLEVLRGSLRLSVSLSHTFL